MKHLRRFFWVCCVLILCVTACAEPTLPPAEHTSESAPDTSATTEYAPTVTTPALPDDVKTKPPLYPKRADAVSKLDAKELFRIAWGAEEHQLQELYINEDMQELVGPLSFTVSPQGMVYVCERPKRTENGTLPTLKIFNVDGSLFKCIPLTNIEGYINNQGHSDIFGIISMTVIGDALYMLDGAADSVFVMDADYNISKLELDVEMGVIAELWSTYTGELVIMDNYWQDGSIRVQMFDTNGKKLPLETKMGFTIIRSAWPFFDPDGNLIRMYDNGYKSYTIIKTSPDGEVLQSIPFVEFYEELQDPAFDINMISRSSLDLLATDKEGRLYMEFNYLYGEQAPYPQRNRFLQNDYILRLDVETEKIEIMQIPVIEDPYDAKYRMSTGGYFTKPIVQPDGTIYKAYVTEKDGVMVYRFSFDD